MLRAMRSALGENDMMAYLAMMAVRLIELHRVLRQTGSLYLHCDPTASHYLKVILDSIFGIDRFLNEITWKRTSPHNDAKSWSRTADKILFYAKGSAFIWNTPYSENSEEYQESHYSNTDSLGRRFQHTSLLSPSPRPNMMYEWKGFPTPPMGWRYSRERMAELDGSGLIYYPTTKDGALDLSKRPRLIRYLDEQKGVVRDTVWTDIPPINARAQERLGYPTQKPLALLERILAASTNVDSVVLDPFCGCGTTVHAAQKLGRTWIGIDATHLAIGLIERRLTEAFPRATFEVHGVPTDLDGARDLAERDKHEFQKWITGTIGAQPYKGGKKGMDRGVDGYLHFRDGDKKAQFAVVSVKGGGIKSGDVRDLKGTMEREKAALGLFLSLKEPTREMEREAASAGIYETGGQKVPRLQILRRPRSSKATSRSCLSGTPRGSRRRRPTSRPGSRGSCSERDRGSVRLVRQVVHAGVHRGRSLDRPSRERPRGSRRVTRQPCRRLGDAALPPGDRLAQEIAGLMQFDDPGALRDTAEMAVAGLGAPSLLQPRRAVGEGLAVQVEVELQGAHQARDVGRWPAHAVPSAGTLARASAARARCWSTKVFATSAALPTISSSPPHARAYVPSVTPSTEIASARVSPSPWRSSVVTTSWTAARMRASEVRVASPMVRSPSC